MNCDVGEVMERLENEQSLHQLIFIDFKSHMTCMGGSPGDVSEEPVM